MIYARRGRQGCASAVYDRRSDSNMNKALSPWIWAVSRDVSKPDDLHAMLNHFQCPKSRPLSRNRHFEEACAKRQGHLLHM